MENQVIVTAALKKFIGWCKVSSMGSDIIYPHYVQTYEQVGKREGKRVFNTDGIIEVLNDCLVTKHPHKDAYFSFLSASEKKAIEKITQEKRFEEYRSIIDSLIHLNLTLKDIYGDKEAEVEKRSQNLMDLFGVASEKQAIAKRVLDNDIEFKYKSDKIKEFIFEGFTDEDIIRIMSLRKDMEVNLGYINSIRGKM